MNNPYRLFSDLNFFFGNSNRFPNQRKLALQFAVDDYAVGDEIRPMQLFIQAF